MSDPPLLAEARRLASLGLRTLICEPRGKAPLTPHGVLNASSDLRQLALWARMHPDANLGLAIPNGMVVLDVDDPAAAEEHCRERALPIPRTARVATGKGYHLYFRIHRDLRLRNAVRLFPGADIRSFGGYALVPPSVHPNGATYRWEIPFEEIVDAPNWLISQALHAAEGRHGATPPPPGTSPGSAGAPAETLAQRFQEGVAEGCRNDRLTRLVGTLVRHRVPRSLIDLLALAVNEFSCKPPLQRGEVFSIVASICGHDAATRTEGRR